MKLDFGGGKCLGSPVQVDTDAGDAQNICLVAEDGNLIPLCSGDFSVDEKFFDAFGAAG